jgi:endonuclease/exonuclease/phosphatase family metal-dependent hydrolase
VKIISHSMLNPSLRRWSDPPTIKDMNLNLISCNIRFDNPADGTNAWTHRRDFLAETLLKTSPDIIATQEGRYDQLKDFETLIKDYDLIDFHRSWIKERMYPTLFVRKHMFEMLKSEDLWLSETPEVAGSRSFESAFPRLMTYLKLQPKNSKKNFFIVNTHLDHIKAETRLSQAEVLATQIKRMNPEKSSIILMGDFNDSPESAVRNKITSELDLVDAWKVFNQKEETSHHGFDGTAANGSRSDWILLDRKIKTTECHTIKDSRDGKYPSDHFPIFCQIKI